MLPNDFPEFVDFVATHFEGVNRRLDGLERHSVEVDGRFEEMHEEIVALREELRSLILVSVEQMRSDFRTAGEGVQLNRENIERNNRELAEMMERLSTSDLRLLDHEERIRAIEA